MKKAVLLSLAFFAASLVFANNTTNSFYGSSMTYHMTGTVLNITMSAVPSTPAVLKSILVSTGSAVSNNVTLSIVRRGTNYVLWTSGSFVGTTALYYPDNDLNVVQYDTLRVEKAAATPAGVILNWK